MGEFMNEEKRQPCEIFSRVVGYFRPVSEWNDAQKEIFKDRRKFKIEDNKNTIN